MFLTSLNVTILSGASTNGWDPEKKIVLPAFLRGQVSFYFNSLKANEKDTYAHLMSTLRKRFCPMVAIEQHYSDFEQSSFRPN